MAAVWAAKTMLVTTDDDGGLRWINSFRYIMGLAQIRSAEADGIIISIGVLSGPFLCLTLYARADEKLSRR